MPTSKTRRAGLNGTSFRVVARHNNTLVKSPCRICGQTNERAAEVDLFTADTDEFVCYSCAKRHSPKLLNAIEWFWREVGFGFDELAWRDRMPALIEKVLPVDVEDLTVATEDDTSRLENAASAIAEARAGRAAS
jgi:hypothetical protein